jgi:hypothetical protein
MLGWADPAALDESTNGPAYWTVVIQPLVLLRFTATANVTEPLLVVTGVALFGPTGGSPVVPCTLTLLKSGV